MAIPFSIGTSQESVDEAVQKYLDSQMSPPTQTFRVPASAAGFNASSVKAAPGAVSAVTGYNTSATPRYLKFYDKASVPTVGADTPYYVHYVAGQSEINIPLGPEALSFSTGIAFAIVNGPDDSNADAPDAGDIMALNIVFF